MRYPDGLHVIERPASTPGAPWVVLVHGSLDRAESFQRVIRRLPDLGIVAYDRRGYQGSRQAGVVGLPGHVADLTDVLSEVRSHVAAPVAVIGHSLGGDVVVGAALAAPHLCDAVGAFEPPMPWLGFRRSPPGQAQSDGWSPLSEDPALEVERFFSRMVSPSAWQRLTPQGRAAREADGPALVADLLCLRGPSPFDVMDLTVPSLFGRGGPESARHHREGVAWLASHVPGAELYEIEGAQHGAHLSHPDHFALFVRRAVARASH